MKYITNYYLLLVLFISAVFVNTNAQNIQWTQTYGGPGDDGAQSMVLSNDGNIVFAGFKSPAAYTYRDVLLMKYNTAGNMIWEKIYNLNMNDIARSIRLTSDGGYIIAGMTEVTPQIHDPFLIKTDANGNVLWQRQYDNGLGLDDRAHSVWQTSDGGYVIAGQTRMPHGSFYNYDFYLVKTDANGNVLWKKTYFRENEGNDAALAIQQLNDGGFIIGGFTQSSIWASYLIRTNGTGDTLWSRIYPGAWQSECYDVQAIPGGGFVITGTETSYQTDADLLISKIDANGNLVWKKIYGTEDAEDGEKIQLLSDGGFIVSGKAASATNSYDVYVIRTNAMGDSLWSKTIGGQGDDRGHGVVSLPGGGYAVSGLSWSYGQGMGDVYLMKITESLVSVKEINNNPAKFLLSQNYPNPFNPATVISYELPVNGSVKLIIYNSIGEIVETLIDKEQRAGKHEVIWNASGYSSGIYFYTLESEEFSETKKMILIK